MAAAATGGTAHRQKSPRAIPCARTVLPQVARVTHHNRIQASGSVCFWVGVADSVRY